jgi:hypothetical protein
MRAWEMYAWEIRAYGRGLKESASAHSRSSMMYVWGLFRIILGWIIARR